jgi:hypothetical protein
MGFLDHLKQRTAARLEEIIGGNPSAVVSPSSEGAKEAPPSASSSVGQSGRRRHACEAPFTKPSEFGHFRLRFADAGFRITTPDGDPMTLQDAFAHTMVFGESGSGKTFFLLNQYLEEFLRATHLSDGPDRERRKAGGLIFDPKGDFTGKSWFLAQKYGRMDDVVFIGPDHLDFVYDLFGDPTESAQQRAAKMCEIIKAYGGGKTSTVTNADFFDQAALKLFTNIFLLHQHLVEAGADVPPMDFKLLGLTLMDRGTSSNSGSVNSALDKLDALYGKLHEGLAAMRSLLLRIGFELNAVAKRVNDRDNEIKSQQKALDKASDAEFAARLNAQAGAMAALAAVKAFVEGSDFQGHKPFAARVRDVTKLVSELAGVTDSQERSERYDKIMGDVDGMVSAIQNRLGDIGEEFIPGALREQLLQLLDVGLNVKGIYTGIIAWKRPREETGMLKRLLQVYEDHLRSRGQDPRQDVIYSYFFDEHLNPANERTSGSVSMTASNVVGLFLHPPFCHIFSPRATFDFKEVIDRGKIVVLDMPTGTYGASALVAAIALKVDFFRIMLSRKRLQVEVKDSDGLPTGQFREMNQERPMFYLVDEFASIATTGDFTGEAGFMDKAREFKCACVLGLLSESKALGRLPEHEIGALIGISGTKIFLRNTDVKTTELASKLFGQKDRVVANINRNPLEKAFDMNRAIGADGHTFSMARTARFEPGDFTVLKDGEAIIRLNPRFGKNAIKRVQFKGHPIEPPASDPVPMPKMTAPPTP